MRRFLLFCICFALPLQLSSQLQINEFLSSNSKGIKDEDGEYSDWIELYNNSSSILNLEGYHISDQSSFLSKWTLPNITLYPGTFQVIFASGKNRVEVPVSFQTVIDKSDSWRYIVPTTTIPNAWKTTGFNDSSWESGNSGFGYGDNDDATQLPYILSVFIRKEFTINRLSDIVSLILSIDYDDGFVAYINGHEIARSNVGDPGTEVPYNYGTGSINREASLYRGGQPENYVISDLQSFLVEGVNVIAIQGHNSAASSSDFSLIPMLTLGYIGGGYSNSYTPYLTLPAVQLHTNFKISSEGESLYLSKPDSTYLDSVSGTPLISDISFGRSPNGGKSWKYFAISTPGSANSSPSYNSMTGDSVFFSYSGGYFPGGIQVKLSTIDPSDTIVFTVDGSEPDITDSKYTVPIVVNTDMIIRARALNASKLPGKIFTNTYFRKQHKLPVVCITTDPYNLWDNDSGIYVLGPNAEVANPFFGANFWQDWEKKAHMEYYDVEGNKQIDQEIGIKIFGNYSRANPQKSLSLFARASYGKGSFEYQFFKDKPIEKFESLVLRNGGNDWAQAFVRDGFTSTLIRDMDVDRQAFQPVVVYLNGDYWGILDLREKINPNFIAENHLINPDSINILENYATVLDGVGENYLELLDFVNAKTTLESEADYLHVTKQIDMDNYIQYQLTQIYINNKDWPGNNIRFWSSPETGNKWRWIIFDTDFGFSIWEGNAASYNTLNFALETNGPNWPNPPWSTLLFRRMVTNPEFRKEFANQYADRINTNFKSTLVRATLDSLKALYLPEIDDHIVRWGLDYANWENNYLTIKFFSNDRPVTARSHLQTRFGLGSLLNLYLTISSPGTGSIKLNSIIPKKYPFSGVYFKNLPVKLTAIPAPGYKFVRWEGNFVSTSATIDFDMSSAGSFNAVFEPALVTDVKMIINEINYSSSPEKDTKDWVELYNAGNTPVNLKNWILSDAGPEFGYVFPNDLIVTPGNYVIVCKDLSAFRAIHPTFTASVGDFAFGLSSAGDDVNLFNPDSVLVDWVNFAVYTPWPMDANGTGASIELVNPEYDNNLGGNWRSSPNGGSPASFNVKSQALNTKEETLVLKAGMECFPNPFTDFTTLRIEVVEDGDYLLEIFDIQGRLIKILAKENIQAGAYYIDWDGTDSNGSRLSSGVYYITMTGEGLRQNLKVVMMN